MIDSKLKEELDEMGSVEMMTPSEMVEYISSLTTSIGFMEMFGEQISFPFKEEDAEAIKDKREEISIAFNDLFPHMLPNDGKTYVTKKSETLKRWLNWQRG